MAKMFKGAIKLASTIQQTGAQPLDDRVVVATVSDLYNSFGTAIYNGMLVAVAETGDVYMLKDDTKVGEAAGWKLIGGDTAAADLTKVKEDVAANKAAIGVINGTGDGSIAKAVSDAKNDLIGDDATADTIRHAEKLATDASEKVDTEIGKLDVTGNTSDAVKGVTVTVDETDGKVIKPVVSIADGTLTGAATDGNLVTGTVVKTYVDGKVKTITDNANTLSGRVDKLDATHTTKGDGSFNTVAEEVTTGIAGITETSKANTAGSDVVVTVTTKSGSVSSVAVDSSVLKKAVTDGDASVKSDLIDNATGDYNTLGKLEGKIKEEASTARAEEKKNADAIAAEVTRAKAAEGQVKTDLIGGATEDYNTLGKLETKIKAAQSAADKVSGVKSGDKVISLGADGKLSSTISLSIDATAGDDGKKYIHLNGIGGADLGKIDIADFVKDGMLTDAELVTNPAGQSAGTYIKLTWNTDGGKQPMYIDVTSLIDVYTAGNGLNLINHVFSVDTTKIATVESVNGVTDRVSTLEGKVATIEGEGEGSIKKAVADEASRAKAAEKKNADAITAETTRATAAEAALLGTDGDAATKDTIKGAKKAVEDLKSQIEKDAVTLTIPENDPYITASKEGNTNKYTIKSKLDADGKTPLVDVKITDKINSLDGGGTSPAVKGISVTVTETAGKISTPTVTVTPGKVAADDASVVTGGAVYTAVEAAKAAASSALTAALTWVEI